MPGPVLGTGDIAVRRFLLLGVDILVGEARQYTGKQKST